jgi:hypothetical protein
MSILDYSKLTHFLYIILQQLSSFIDIDWAENWRYIENLFHIVNKLRSQKVIQKFLTWNQLVSTLH